MDLYSFLNVQAFLLVPFVIYILFSRKPNGRSLYTNRDIFYPVKYYLSRKIVKQFQDRNKKKRQKYGYSSELEFKKFDNEQWSYFQSFRAMDETGNGLTLKLTVRPSKVAELILILRLSNGKIYTIPGSEKISVQSIRENQWRINGLLIDNLQPYRRLRIVYNGLLQDISCTSYEKIEHVQFNLIFNCCSEPYFFPDNYDSGLLTEALATSVWKDASWKTFLGKQARGYEQFGALIGFVKGDAFSEDHVLHLPTCRSKYHGPDDRYLLNRSVNIFLVDSHGVLINLNLKLYVNGDTHLNYGHVIHKYNETVPITRQDLRIECVGGNKSVPDLIVVHINTKTKEYLCALDLNKNAISSVGSDESDFELLSVPAECNINSRQGKSLAEFWYYNTSGNIILPQIKPLLLEKKVKNLPEDLVVNIQDENAKILNLTGGKGTSLALLATMSTEEFVVPPGIILTVNAFKHHLSEHPHLNRVIQNIEDVFYKKNEGKREEACAEAADAIKKGHISVELLKFINKGLDDVKRSCSEDGTGSISWAVRSSAISEDSEELSAAGQNETVLGCTTEEKLKQAILTCWASLYTYQSVQYRWQHGLPIRTDMAVVIQKMVPSDSAGVLFTWHPSTNDPSQMVITSNYGLGESVVSGVSEPDTFILNRNYSGQVCLLDQVIGSKTKVITLGDDGTKETDTINDQNEGFLLVEKNGDQNWSITKEQAVKLGKIGLMLEELFGGPRDIEWAFYKNRLYLLQSRPITTLTTWTEYELTHEFDNPVNTKNSVYTMANVGEVYPLAISALGQTVAEMLDRGVQLTLKKTNTFTRSSVICSHNRLLIDIVMSLHKNAKHEIEMASKILDLAIFGHVVINESINQMVLDRLGPTTSITMAMEFYKMVSKAWSASGVAKKAKELSLVLDYGVRSEDDIQTIREKLRAGFNSLQTLSYYHSIVSGVSVFYQIICMNILIGKTKELHQDHHVDFANILMSCDDVVSAEVPVYLEKIARVVRNAGLAEEFSEVSAESGVDWLRIKCPESYILFEEFLEKHGHRAVGEFELSVETWGIKPSKVIPMIQANTLHMTDFVKEQKSTDEIISQLVSPLTSGNKRALKFVMARLRTAVGLREQTKSAVILGVHKTRLAYRQLAVRMVRDGLLPGEDLIFHLTDHELNDLIQNGNVGLVTKAIQRQRLYPKWTELKFPEVIYGVPQPINEIDIPIELKSGTKCVGTTACMGNVQARACVITHLDEIGQLQKGDILITYSTDIGWSPYFPMLSGVVTELGGLVSHGAVVAREYGLPCIVGVKNLTKMFKTGDIVFLNGKTGELGKVEEQY